MKTDLKTVSLGMLLASTSWSSLVFAACPEGLVVEERISCIRIEGAGVSYQDYLAERAEIIAAAIAARTQGIETKRQDLKAKDEVEADTLSTTLSK